MILHSVNPVQLVMAISGTDVGAFSMTLDYPFAVKKRSSNSFQLETTDNLVYLFVGSTSSLETQAEISWSEPVVVVPVEPVPVPVGAIMSLNGLVLAVLGTFAVLFF